MTEALRNNLKVHRARLDLTQAQLAERVGVTRRSINAIEAGRMNPSVLLALKISAALGFPVEHVFSLSTEATDAGGMPTRG